MRKNILQLYFDTDSSHGFMLSTNATTTTATEIAATMYTAGFKNSI